MPIRRYFNFHTLLKHLGHHLPPSPQHLSTLSRADRPGLRIQMPKSHIELGRICLRSQQYDQALHHFEQAIRDNPEDSWAWHGKGDSLQGKKDYINALNAYHEASQLAPNEGLHWGGKANAHQGLHHPLEQDSCRVRALELDPSLSWMFNQ